MEPVLEVISTKRGAPCLVIDGFRFRRDKQRRSAITWRCTRDGCRARCATDLQLQELTTAPGDHNHEKPDEEAIDVERVRTSIKRKALDNTETAGRIVCEEAAKTSTVSYRQIKNLKNSVYRARLKQTCFAKKS